MTELHLYFAKCLKTLSAEYTAGLEKLHVQLEKLLNAWARTADETQHSMQSLERRVSALERNSQQDPSKNLPK